MFKTVVISLVGLIGLVGFNSVKAEESIKLCEYPCKNLKVQANRTSEIKNPGDVFSIFN